jgi:hypothetical protein
MHLVRALNTPEVIMNTFVVPEHAAAISSVLACGTTVAGSSSRRDGAGDIVGLIGEPEVLGRNEIVGSGIIDASVGTDPAPDDVVGA